MTEPEPTVQVPVSLIEEAAWVFQVTGRRTMESKFRALLSQPTPTAEPMSAAEFSARWQGVDVAARSLGRHTVADSDPSTIRDVTPPNESIK